MCAAFGLTAPPMFPAGFIVRAICSIRFTKYASVRRGRTSSRPSSAWMPTASNRRGRRISEYAGGNLPNGGYNIATACQYYENLRIASRVFSALGETNQSAGYLRQAEEVKAGISSNLFNGEFYLARTDRKEMFPLASAWTLRFDIEPATVKSKILDAIEKAGKPNIGGYGGDAFYSGLLN